MNCTKSLLTYPQTTKYKLVLCFVIAFIFSGFSQTKQKPKPIEGKPSKLITIRHAKRLAYDQSLGVDARRLIGDVECEHEGAVMRCDSAYLFSDKKLIAYGHISIIKGDSIFVYGDSLRYDAATKLATELPISYIKVLVVSVISFSIHRTLPFILASLVAASYLKESP